MSELDYVIDIFIYIYNMTTTKRNPKGPQYVLFDEDMNRFLCDIGFVLVNNSKDFYEFVCKWNDNRVMKCIIRSKIKFVLEEDYFKLLRKVKDMEYVKKILEILDIEYDYNKLYIF